MFNANGSMRKTAKTKLFQSFSRYPVLEVPSAYITLSIWGLSGDLHPQHLMIEMQRQVVVQTTYGLITSIKCAR